MSVSVITGDCLDVLRGMPAGSVECCVTSPPYWGLRDYGHAGQLGLEPTPDEYVASMVRVFQGVRHVLSQMGTLWVNLGDSYAATTKGSGGHNEKQDSNKGSWHSDRQWSIPDGLKPKDLCGIPWRVAFALQADGWYLRSDIIWSKPNPMPESVTDRPTKAHEYIFLLSKSPRYYYDAEAIAEPVSASMLAQLEAGYNGTATKDYEGAGVQDPSAVKSRILKRAVDGYGANAYLHPQSEPRGPKKSLWDGALTRNKRSVWTVTTKPFAGAHFATFPPDLIEPCILAGCPVGGTVLDPFGGAGTTGLVADRLQRNAILIELNPEYADMARQRITGDSPLFAEVV